MKLKTYFIEFDTGEICKERPKGMELCGGFETFDYRTAQAVARLLKKGDLEAALAVANNGIEKICAKAQH